MNEHRDIAIKKRDELELVVLKKCFGRTFYRNRFFFFYTLARANCVFGPSVSIHIISFSLHQGF